MSTATADADQGVVGLGVGSGRRGTIEARPADVGQYVESLREKGKRQSMRSKL